MNKLDGYKTHIQAVLMVVSTLLWNFGYIPTDVWVTIMTLLGAGTVSSIHHAVTRTRNAETSPVNETE